MKTIKIILTSIVLLSFSTIGMTQLSISPTVNIHSIGDFELTYDAFGLDLNGELSKKWALGMQADYGKYNDIRFMSFNPNAKVYSKSSFQGIYFGLGLRYFKAKRLGEERFPDPLSDNETNISFMGPELKLGIASIIDDCFSMSFEIHTGNAFDLDEPFYGANFSFGFYLY